MAVAAGKDAFSDLERHRLRLEETVSKLRKSLQHWQTWEAEYEGLKEEILASGTQSRDRDLVAVVEDFGGTLVTRKEIKELFEDKRGVTRTGKQVVDLLSKRIDYVHQNVNTIQKQLQAAEEKLSALLVLQQPEVRNEEGLPVTEIREELDEDGNVIASSTSVPGEAGPQVVEALRKAGVSELDGLERKDDQGKVDPDVKDTDSQVVPNKTWPDKANQATAKDSSAKNATASSTQASVTATSSAKSRSKGPRKSVTFAEDTKEEPLISSNRSVLGLPELPAKKANPTPIVNSQIKDISDSKDSPSAIVPENESPEDAKLRKEMLQYGLSEVGAVVAELALEESGSETSYSDIEFEEEDGEEEYSSSVEDEEDKFGRSTRREVTDDYRREMRELEMRLNARAMENVGPKMGPSDDGTDDVAQDVKQIVVDIGGTGDQSNAKSDGSVKKAVRFAPELDISPAPERRMEDMSQFKDSKSALPPLNEAVIERQNQITKPPSTSSPTQRKVSRFKSSLSKVHTPTEDNQVPATTPPEANKPSINQSLPELIPTHNKSSPLHPSASAINHHLDSKPDNPMLPNIPQTHHTPSTPLSAQIIERPTPMTQTPPTEPDDLDPKLLNQQVATEYHRMRNRFIQREGGFRVREDEEGIVPLTEEAGRKISRFKAAKLGRGES